MAENIENLLLQKENFNFLPFGHALARTLDGLRAARVSSTRPISMSEVACEGQPAVPDMKQCHALSWLAINLMAKPHFSSVTPAKER